jgi:hypothetical protein
VSFNGSADITVTAAAGTLTGATLASGVTASSLTSLGTITSLTATALTVNDNTTLGSSNSDTVVFNARVASDLNPSTDDTYDLGIVGHEWRNLRIDGTANIDSLVADTADINGGTIDGTAIGATTPSTGAFTTLSASGQITSPASTDLTLAGGSSGASLVLGQGANGAVTIAPAGTGDINLTAAGSGSFVYVNAVNPILFINETDQSADARLWAMQSEGGLFKLRAFNDALSSAVDTFAATRTGNLLIGTTDATGLTGAGGLKINSSTAGSAGAGALVVTGGLATGAASYFGGAVTVTGALSATGDVTLSGGVTKFTGSAIGSGGEVWVGSDNVGGLFLNAPTGEEVRLGINNSALARLSATGLAVTGALSSTGALAIGNTVATAVAVASTHKVTIVIGGTTYYLLATNV